MTAWIKGKIKLLLVLTFAIGAIGIAGWLLESDFSASAATDVPNAPPPEQTKLVEVVTVNRQENHRYTTYPGIVRAVTIAELAFRVGGPLVKVNISPGDNVKAGDILLEIDSRDFERHVEAATAALESALAKHQAMKKGARDEDLQAIKARRDALLARQANLRTEYGRSERLLRVDAISKSEYDMSKTDLTAMDDEIRAVDQELKKAMAGARQEDMASMSAKIRALRTQLNIAKDQLADTRLLAPFDATVAKQLVENFEHVEPNQTVVMVHDVSMLEIHFSLPEKEVVRRSFDEPFDASVKLLSMPDNVLSATFKELDTEADPATRTYRVTFVLQPVPDMNVLPGMVVEVSLESATDHDQKNRSVTVPTSAILSDSRGEQFVWVLNDNSVLRRPVKLGQLLRQSRYQVISGLQSGESVVVSGAVFLHEGEQVQTSNVDRVVKVSYPHEP